METNSNPLGAKFVSTPPKERYEGLDLTDGDVRAGLVEFHPLITRNVVLKTPPIEDLYKDIRRIVLLHEVGGYATAKSGVGKSYALDMVAHMLETTIPNLVVLLHETETEQQLSIRAFFKQFLGTIGHPNKKGETWDLRERLSNALVDLARYSGRDLIVLLIDEAQAMPMQDFLFLKDISNELEREGVQLIAVLMGQEPDFSTVIDMLREGRRLDLVGRFAMRQIPFRGYSEIGDLKAILRGIDENCFPDDTGWAWTRFFFPKEWDSGFRMEDEAASLMKALRQIRPKGQSFLEVPARQLFLAIRAFMYDNVLVSGSTRQCIDKDAWKKALAYGQVAAGMELMQVPRRESRRVRR